MKRPQLKLVAGASLLAALFSPGAGIAQRSTVAVPRFLAVPFQSPGEPKLGIDVAEAVRQRMIRLFPQPAVRAGQVRIVTREEINTTMVSFGYAPDSTISTGDLGDLGRSMAVNESMEGSVRRTAAGVEARSRFFLTSNVNVAEVLPVVVDKDPASVGKRIADLYVQARKELPDYERCKNALIQNQPDAAIAAANAAMKQYAGGVLPRACLLTAYSPQYGKMPADSIIRVANEIIAIDPDNLIAYTQLVDAYREKGDLTSAVSASVRVAALSRSNLAVVQRAVDVIINAGTIDTAIRIVDETVRDNPDDLSMIETQFKLMLRARQWKRAIAAGERMVTLDSAKADTNYFSRQIGAAYQDSQPQLALQFLKGAVTKFPRDVRLLQGYSRELVAQGRLREALDATKKLVAVNPAISRGNATIVSLYGQLGFADSAVSFARTALAGADSATRAQIGVGLQALIAPAMKKAQADTAASADARRSEWTDVYQLSAAVDSIVPQPATAFYMSLAAYYLGRNAVDRVAPLSQAKNAASACAELKTAGDMLLQVDLNMMRGGSFDRDNAAAILKAASAIKPYITENRTSLRCR